MHLQDCALPSPAQPSRTRNLDNSKPIECTSGLEHICKALLEAARCPAPRPQGRDYSGRGSNNRKTMTKKLPVHCSLSGNTEICLGSKDKMKGAEQ